MVQYSNLQFCSFSQIKGPCFASQAALCCILNFFLEKEPRKYVGHNPLAQAVMFLMLTWGTIFMIFTGFALYSEGEGKGSWADTLFGWVIPLFGQSQDVHTWHHLGMWYILVFVITHIYVAIREDIMSRQSLVSTMISGWRMFKDDRP